VINKASVGVVFVGYSFLSNVCNMIWKKRGFLHEHATGAPTAIGMHPTGIGKSKD
jgi:hypothetical protein